LNLNLDEFAVTTILESESWETNDSPPGVIFYLDTENLSKRLNVNLEVLKSTIKNLEKIKEAREKVYKDGRHELKFINWDKKQHPFLSQKKYREHKRAEKLKSQQANKVIADDDRAIAGDNPDIAFGRDRDTDKDELKIKIKKEDGKEDSYPSHPRDQFLYELKEAKGYPFNKDLDGQIYDLCIRDWPMVDPVREVKKKKEYWGKNPGALTSKGKGPRVQLVEFFKKEDEYQNGGPRK
jgi:hypothetical protein